MGQNQSPLCALSLEQRRGTWFGIKRKQRIELGKSLNVYIHTQSSCDSKHQTFTHREDAEIGSELCHGRTYRDLKIKP